MIAPDFTTQVTEVVSYGETAGFIIKDTTGAYDSQDNPGGWDPDGGAGPNMAPEDVLQAMIIVTPYQGDDIPIILEMQDNLSDLYWQKLLDHLAEDGISLDLTNLGLGSFADGHWVFKSYYWEGLYNSTYSGGQTVTLSLGEIVQGATSGATGYYVGTFGGNTAVIAPIQGTWTNGETVTGLTSSNTLIIDTFTLNGTWLANEDYSYTNHQSILTATRNTIRKLPLDIELPRINEKHAYHVGVADMLLETLDDAVEVGQIENYEEIFDYTAILVERIDQTYCID